MQTIYQRSKDCVKVEAYICDYGNHLVHVDGIVGVNPIEDMFDKISSYPICHQDKTRIHICGECYREHVLIPAQNMVDRKKDERLYELKVKELGYDVRSKAVRNYWAREVKKSTKNTGR